MTVYAYRDEGDVFRVAKEDEGVNYNELFKEYADDRDRMDWASGMMAAKGARERFVKRIVEMAERSCPYKKGQTLTLKKPFRKMDEAIVEAVASPFFDADTLRFTGDEPWTVIVRLCKADRTPSAVTTCIGAGDIAAIV